MATNYPTTLDALSNPAAGDQQVNPSHSAQHANANDAIEALQAKVGVNGSLVTSSHDYKIAAVQAATEALQAALAALGTLSSQNSNNVAITGGTISGVTLSATNAAIGAATGTSLNLTSTGTQLTLTNGSGTGTLSVSSGGLLTIDHSNGGAILFGHNIRLLNSIGDITVSGSTLTMTGATTVAVNAISVSGLTAGRVPYVSTAGLLADNSAFLFDNPSSTLTCYNFVSTNAYETSGSGALFTSGGANVIERNPSGGSTLRLAGNSYWQAVEVYANGSVVASFTPTAQAFTGTTTITKASSTSDYYGSAGLRILSGASDAALVIGADAANDLVYLQTLNLGTAYGFTLSLQPAGGSVAVGGAMTVGTTLKPGTYTVAGLPAGSAGMVVYCSNLRVFDGAGTQQTAGNGTGGLVVHNGSAWKNMDAQSVTAVA